MKHRMPSHRTRAARTLLIGLLAAVALAAGQMPTAGAQESSDPTTSTIAPTTSTTAPAPSTEAPVAIDDVPPGAEHPEAVESDASEFDHDHDHAGGAAPAGDASRAVVEDIAFPVLGPVNFTDTYGAPRGSGRLHIGTDIMADKLQEIVAVDDGEIFWVSYGGSNYLYLRADSGYRYVYIHLNNDSPFTDDGKQCFGASNCVANAQWVFPEPLKSQIVRSGTTKYDPGVRVSRGQHIAWVGDSGNAESTASHLHFEMHVPGSGYPDWTWYPGDGPSTYVNPYPTLAAAQANTGPDGTGTEVVTGNFDADPEDEVLLYGPGNKPDSRFEPAGELGEFTEVDINVIGTYQPLVGDFDGNGYDDILWYAPGAAKDYYWYHHSGGYTSVETRIIGTYVPQIGDYDANGYDDILWYAAGTPKDYYWHHQSGGYISTQTTIIGSYAPLVSDYDGNGYDDILWYAAGAAKDYYWHHDTSGYVSSSATIFGTYTPFVGDLDGNGQSDIYWYAKGSAPDYFWYHSPGGYESSRSDNLSDGRGGSGDLDADGTEEIVWFTDRGVEPARVWTDTGGQISEIQATVL